MFKISNGSGNITCKVDIQTTLVFDRLRLGALQKPPPPPPPHLFFSSKIIKGATLRVYSTSEIVSFEVRIMS